MTLVHVQPHSQVLKAATAMKTHCKLEVSWGVGSMLKSLQKQLQRRHRQLCLKMDTIVSHKYTPPPFYQPDLVWKWKSISILGYCGLRTVSKVTTLLKFHSKDLLYILWVGRTAAVVINLCKLCWWASSVWSHISSLPKGITILWRVQYLLGWSTHITCMNFMCPVVIVLPST